jgi:hypothetical protein
MHPDIKRKVFNDINNIINYNDIKKEAVKVQAASKLDNVNNKKRTKMSKQSLFEQMKTLWETFEEQHNGTTKKSQQEARKAVGEIKKLVTNYRKASVEESK